MCPFVCVLSMGGLPVCSKHFIAQSTVLVRGFKVIVTHKQTKRLHYGLRITDYGLYKRQTYLPVTTHQGNQDIVAHFSLHSLNDGPLIPSTN